jgi:hypothetical protein
MARSIDRDNRKPMPAKQQSNFRYARWFNANPRRKTKGTPAAYRHTRPVTIGKLDSVMRRTDCSCGLFVHAGFKRQYLGRHP